MRDGQAWTDTLRRHGETEPLAEQLTRNAYPTKTSRPARSVRTLAQYSDLRATRWKYAIRWVSR